MIAMTLCQVQVQGVFVLFKTVVQNRNLAHVLNWIFYLFFLMDTIILSVTCSYRPVMLFRYLR